MRYAIFNPSNGEILRVLRLPPGMIVLNLQSGEDYLACDDNVHGDKHCVVDGEIVERTIMPFSTEPVILTTADTLRVENIPVGTVVDFPGGSGVIDDGFIEWECDEPGGYIFSFRLFPYQDAVLYATVTE